MVFFEEDIKALRYSFASGRTKSIDFREQQLKNLLRLYEENTSAMIEALQKDLRKHKQESITTEIAYNISDLKYQLENFREWAKPEKPTKGLLNIMDEVMIMNDPYGVVLVIGAWNYPIQLSLLPVAGAIAAGNCVIIKPSELAPACANLLAELIPKYLDANCYKVVLGGPQETAALLENRFDFIFFTGSTRVGKIIHAAANKYLTPVVLELGGKSPVILDKSANMEVAARRILWGKCLNAGQTCVAPDYILCERQVGEQFVIAAKNIIKEWYGEDTQKSPDFCRIINENHFSRLCKLLKSDKVVFGGNPDQSEKYIPFTIVADTKPTDSIMEEEIFGPILPLMYVKNIQQAVDYINDNEKPLALYVFSENRAVTDSILNNTTSGGVCINDTILQLAVETLPFGGVGSSGMGAYHGKYSFDTFVHKKSVLIKDLGKIGETLSKSRYPPYSDAKLKNLKRVLSLKLPSIIKIIPHYIVFSLGIVSVLIGNFINTYYQKYKV